MATPRSTVFKKKYGILFVFGSIFILLCKLCITARLQVQQLKRTFTLPVLDPHRRATTVYKKFTRKPFAGLTHGLTGCEWAWPGMACRWIDTHSH